MSQSSDEDVNLTPVELRQQVVSAELNFLPEKSRVKYLKTYEQFNAWRLSKGAKTYSENVLLSYFMDLSKTRQPSTLWSIYSMLKATIKIKRDLHIETYPKLTAYLKRLSEGHKSKKSKVFTAYNIEKFLNEAPDSIYLATKVALIIGISGACRTSELLNLVLDNIEKHSEKLLLVNLTNTKTKIDRSFVIREEYVNIIEKYKALRPININTNRFFLQYRNKKCSKQPIGVNKIGGFPREIATFLKLQEPQLYTGHCFRRTSATLLADSGADITTLKRHGGWKSSAVAEGYIENSVENKSKISKRIIETINLKTGNPGSHPSTSKESEIKSHSVSPASSPRQSTKNETENLISQSNTQVTNTKITVSNKTFTFNLENCNNFTFNF